MPLAPDLRPRSAVELYDAAIHLCARGRTAAPALAFLGAVPVAIAVVGMCYQARLGHPVFMAALALTVALFFRFICLGAAAVATQDALAGMESSAAACLLRAARFAPRLCVAGAVDLGCRWIGHPLTLGMAFFFWSDLWCAPAVALAGRSSPWLIGGAIRRELGSRSGKGMVLRLLHALAFVVVLINTWVAILALLSLAHAFLGVDVSFPMKFCMPDNWLFDVVMLCVTLVILEPVRAVLGPLLLADARIRSEGLDLREALDRLSAVKLALILFAVGLGAQARADRPPPRHRTTRPSHTQRAPAGLPDAQKSNTERADLDLGVRLSRTASRLGVGSDRQVIEQIDEASSLQGSDRAALVRFADRVDDAIDNDESGTKQAFLLGLGEAARTARARPAAPGPRELARQILARPEFAPIPERVAEEKHEDPKQAPGWLRRFAEWLAKMWKKFFGEDHPSADQSPSSSVPGLSGPFFRVLAYLLAGAAIAAVVWLVLRVVVARDEERPELEGSGAGGAEPSPDVESALSRAPRTWWEQAEALAGRGDFRGAIRSVYLALLASLHARGAIDYDTTRSNWDYCRHFRGEPTELDPFRELTLGFDFAWYGRIGATPDGYERFRSLAQPLISHPPG